MNKIHSSIALCLVLLITCFIGCIEENQEAEKEIDPSLTEEDWGYFQFHYHSGKKLDLLYREGLSILNTEIDFVNMKNSSFLIELNSSNPETLYQLRNLSASINLNLSTYQAMLQNYTVSSYFTNHKKEQENLFSVFENLSYVYFDAYIRIRAVYNSPDYPATYIDISDTMSNIFMIEQYINNILEIQVNNVVDIPDTIWNEWDNKDFSFMD